MSTEPLENLEQLARRAMACKHWKWAAGMLTCGGWRVIVIDSEGRSVCAKNDFVVISPEYYDALPDLNDPATLGCMLALVREVWNDPTASVWFDDTKYGDGQMWMWRAGDKGRCMYDTEAAALVAPLEAAP